MSQGPTPHQIAVIFVDAMGEWFETIPSEDKATALAVAHERLGVSPKTAMAHPRRGIYEAQFMDFLNRFNHWPMEFLSFGMETYRSCCDRVLTQIDDAIEGGCDRDAVALALENARKIGWG